MSYEEQVEYLDHALKEGRITRAQYEEYLAALRG